MMKGISDNGVVVIGLTYEEVRRLLLGEVRVAPAATDGKWTAPAVRIMYAPTYEALRKRMQEHAGAPLPEIVDLRGHLAKL